MIAGAALVVSAPWHALAFTNAIAYAYAGCLETDSDLWYSATDGAYAGASWGVPDVGATATANAVGEVSGSDAAAGSWYQDPAGSIEAEVGPATMLVPPGFVAKGEAHAEVRALDYAFDDGFDQAKCLPGTPDGEDNLDLAWEGYLGVVCHADGTAMLRLLGNLYFVPDGFGASADSFCYLAAVDEKGSPSNFAWRDELVFSNDDADWQTGPASVPSGAQFMRLVDIAVSPHTCVAGKVAVVT